MELEVGTVPLTALGSASLSGVQVSMKREVGTLKQKSLKVQIILFCFFSVVIIIRRIKSWFVFPSGNIFPASRQHCLSGLGKEAQVALSIITPQFTQGPFLLAHTVRLKAIIYTTSGHLPRMLHQKAHHSLWCWATEFQETSLSLLLFILYHLLFRDASKVKGPWKYWPPKFPEEKQTTWTQPAHSGWFRLYPF